MNPHLFLDAFGSIDAHYIVKAEAVMDSPSSTKTHPNRRPLRYLLIAATLALILASVFIPLALGRDPVSTPEITTPTTPPTTEKDYASLTDIPGATRLESMHYAEPVGDFMPLIEFDTEKWTENIKANHSMFFGKLVDVEAVYFEEDGKGFILSVMTYEVYQSIWNFKETDTVQTVCVSEYSFTSTGNNRFYTVESTYSPYEGIKVKEDTLYRAIQYSNGAIHSENSMVCIVEPSTEMTFTWGDTVYNLSEYAPYYANAVLAHAFGSNIYFATSFGGPYCKGMLHIHEFLGISAIEYHTPKIDPTPVDKSHWPKLNLIDSRH